jgi:thymidine kinase
MNILQIVLFSTIFCVSINLDKADAASNIKKKNAVTHSHKINNACNEKKTNTIAYEQKKSNAQLCFYYAAMNAGKTTRLLISAHNYEERGMKVLLFIPEIDTRVKSGTIASRIGIKTQAVAFNKQFNFCEYIEKNEAGKKITCIFIDEAQFLSKEQVYQLAYLVDHNNITVQAYGLCSDFLGNLFEGSAALLVIADVKSEIETVCPCGKKANMVARINSAGAFVNTGDQIEIGGNDKYVSLCRKHHMEKVKAAAK